MSAADRTVRGPGTAPVVVEVRGPITLGQFLKFSGLAATGGEAKAHVDAGVVRVNGAIESHRGRKLVDGDEVTLRGVVRRVSAPPSSPDTSPPIGKD